MQPESKQRAAGVVSRKTSSVVPLISRDRGREGGRGGGLAGGADEGRQPDADHARSGGAGDGGVSM